jgi:hypothetical protein
MKCQKCGFVSFDHLSECRKCGADLIAIREGLGFSALKSEAPCLLGSLLAGGSKSNTTRVEDGGETADVLFEYDSAPSLPEVVHFAHPAGKPVMAAEDDRGFYHAERDELTIELSEADLEVSPGIEEGKLVKSRLEDQ